jgi:hypothetical protein
VELLEGMLSVKIVRDMLFIELAKVADGWMCRSGWIRNMPEVRLGCSGKLAMERANDRIKNIASGEGATAWCC